MPTNTNRLTPTGTELYVVRWLREDERDVKHKHFTRHHDATAFLDRLHSFGKTAALFTTTTQWKPA